MKLIKALTTAGVLALSALLLTGCGVPSGLFGVAAAEDVINYGKSARPLDRSFAERVLGGVAGDARSESIASYEPAVEASADTAEDFIEYYLYYSSDPANIEAAVTVMDGFQSGVQFSEEQLVEMDPMFPLLRYEGVPLDMQAYYAAHSMAGLAMNAETVGVDDVYIVPEGSATLESKNRAVVDASNIVMSSETYGSSSGMEGAYYLAFTDNGWKIDVERTLSQIG